MLKFLMALILANSFRLFGFNTIATILSVIVVLWYLFKFLLTAGIIGLMLNGDNKNE